MFRQQGAGRTDRQNRAVAGYLAFAGGYVNCVGYVLIGTFTSHATGTVGRFVNDLATGELAGAGTALTMLVAFFMGAFTASMIIESRFTGHPANAYGFALSGEASLLVTFTIASRLTPWAHVYVKDLEAAILCAAMGMQNSLVTRLSGAVVRTTHLTGVLTDLGIEGARWFRWWRASLSEKFRVKLALGRNPAEAPSLPKLALLSTIAGSFTVGAMLGAVLGRTLQHLAMVPAALWVASGAIYAFAAKEGPGSSIPPPASRR